MYSRAQNFKIPIRRRTQGRHKAELVKDVDESVNYRTNKKYMKKLLNPSYDHLVPLIYNATP